MRLIILRHSLANDPRPGQSDNSRELTTAGQGRARNLATFLSKSGLQPDTLYCSTYLRTVQTAEHISRELCKALTPLDELTPGNDLFESLRAFCTPNKYPAGHTVLVCGHQPQMGYLITELLEDDLQLQIYPATLTCIELQDWQRRSGYLAAYFPGWIWDDALCKRPPPNTAGSEHSKKTAVFSDSS